MTRAFTERLPRYEYMSDRTLTIYADYVCPFCYLGNHVLETVEADRDESIIRQWQPFDLRSQQRRADGSIDTSVDDGKDEAYFEQAYQNVRRLQDEYGADRMLDPADVSREIDSLPAQLVGQAIANDYPDNWRAFDQAVYAGLWEAGRDIGSTDVLIELAGTADVPAPFVEEVLADGERREELDAAFASAYRAGVSGVPTFVVDGRVARGAVPPEQLEALLDS